MKRPLLWVCVFLSLLAVLHLRAGTSGGDARETSDAPPGENQRVSFYGRVCGKEFQGDETFLLLTDLSSFQNAEDSRQIISVLNKRKADRIQCFLDAGSFESMPKIGSMVIAEGRFSYFPSATNPGEFDLSKHYLGRRIGGKLQDAKILKEGEKHDCVREYLSDLRTYFGRRLDQVFPAKGAGILRTMLLGDRAELDPELKNLYQRGGILHVLSISGLHVTLLGMGLFTLLRRLGMRGAAAATCAGLVLALYGVMTGMGVSACRAIGMFLLRMLAYLLGRTYDLLTAAGVMACAMLCFTPLYGMNSGFWLSFGSILGIGVILPILDGATANGKGEKKIKAWHERLACSIRETFLAGGSVLLATLPLTLMFYYEVPTYSMLINLLVIPAMGPVLFFGLTAMLIPGLGILGTVSVFLLKIFEWVCLLVSSLPFATWNPGCPKTWQVITYYLALAAVLGILWRVKKKRFPLWIIAALPVILLAVPTHNVTGVTFLDVGQGDCVILRLENGQTWICDCGNGSGKDVGENVLIPFLKHEGIRQIDGVFVTHGDRDHVSGILTLFQQARREQIKIACLYLPKRSEDSEEFRQLTEAADAAGIRQILRLKTGDLLRGENVLIAALHPRPQSGEEGNEASLCLWIEMRKLGDRAAILLTGDVEGSGERELLNELMKRGIKQVGLLKCAHHGSRNATSEEFLKKIDAKITVISCGRRNSYGHPHAETLERLKEDGTRILRTDLYGAIILRMEDGEFVLCDWQNNRFIDMCGEDGL